MPAHDYLSPRLLFPGADSRHGSASAGQVPTPLGGASGLTAWPPFEPIEAADLVATDPEYRRRYLVALERLKRG